jgi:threonyl-tRNA synthetase
MAIDHRRLGRELDLFDSDPLVGAGLPLWLPDGAAARHAVESYVRELERRNGYHHVYSPVLGKSRMYELSGHLAHFADDMFPPMNLGEDLVLRPSLCPHHALIFKSRPRSYRDLPLRMGELGSMFRAERSGVLGGLSRVRSCALNDAHVFCRLDQVSAEVAEVLRLMRVAHAALGIEASSYRLSLRGEDAKYAGDDDAWDAAERLLRQALDDTGMDYAEAAGEGAFYGPKIDVQVADVQGREWTLATVQVDFHQPGRFGLSYADEAGGRGRPVMVHRSLVGSMERLFAHLIEVHQGKFPLWYAPVQLAVLPVAGAQSAAAQAIAAAAIRAGLRAVVLHEGSVGARARAARRVPCVGVVGEREVDGGLLALRRDGEVAELSVADAIAVIASAAQPAY